MPKHRRATKSSKNRFINEAKYDESDETDMDVTDSSPKKSSRESNQTSSRKRKYSLRGQTAERK